MVFLFDCEEEKCDICGVIGVADAIVTCTQCKVNCEHTYCMATLLEEPPVGTWLCEECDSTSKPNKPPSAEISPLVSILSNTVKFAEQTQTAERRKLVKRNWEKMVATGKTKYISVTEAIKLSSGEKKSPGPSNVISHSRNRFPKHQPERSQLRPTVLTVKPQAHGLIDISGRKHPKVKKLTEIQTSVSSPKQSIDLVNKRTQKEMAAEIQLSHTKGRRSIRKNPPLIAPSANDSQGEIGQTAIESRTLSDLKKCDENANNDLLPDLETYSLSPSLDALWTGSFVIKEDDRRGEVNHQIQAHSPSHVRRKIYEFSKQMPKVIHVQLVPLKKFWIDFFEEYTPYERDIGLYFFPGGGERSEDYISLLESITVKNMALRIQIADVELLVFTSKLLPVNCQCWEGKNFLWGVFHNVKQDTSCLLENEVPKLSMKPWEEDNNNNNGDNKEEVDMEIDMIGGISVGREDVRVPRQPIIPRLINIKTEDQDLSIPPGFEEIYRLRVEGRQK
ncbi:hypothetical protein ABFX02_09G044500 [Erythranthe guttata]